MLRYTFFLSIKTTDLATHAVIGSKPVWKPYIRNFYMSHWNKNVIIAESFLRSTSSVIRHILLCITCLISIEFYHFHFQTFKQEYSSCQYDQYSVNDKKLTKRSMKSKNIKMKVTFGGLIAITLFYCDL